MNIIGCVDSIGRDLRQALRGLRGRPGLSIIMISMLAVGIGATTAMFSLFHQALVQPLPVPEPDRMVNIVRASSGQRAEALLYGLSSWDPAVLGASAAILVAVMLVASYWPARRASKIGPMEALRYE